MKLNIKKELHAKSVTELQKQLLEARSEQRVMMLDREMGKLKNTSSLKGKRVEIAVIRTIINEKLAIDKIADVSTAESKKEILTKDKPEIKKVKNDDKTKKKSAAAKTKADKGGKK